MNKTFVVYNSQKTRFLMKNVDNSFEFITTEEDEETTESSANEFLNSISGINGQFAVKAVTSMDFSSILPGKVEVVCLYNPVELPQDYIWIGFELYKSLFRTDSQMLKLLDAVRGVG